MDFYQFCLSWYINVFFSRAPDVWRAPWPCYLWYPVSGSRPGFFLMVFNAGCDFFPKKYLVAVKKETVRLRYFICLKNFLENRVKFLWQIWTKTGAFFHSSIMACFLNAPLGSSNLIEYFFRSVGLNHNEIDISTESLAFNVKICRDMKKCPKKLSLYFGKLSSWVILQSSGSRISEDRNA